MHISDQLKNIDLVQLVKPPASNKYFRGEIENKECICEILHTPHLNNRWDYAVYYWESQYYVRSMQEDLLIRNFSPDKLIDVGAMLDQSAPNTPIDVVEQTRFLVNQNILCLTPENRLKMIFESVYDETERLMVELLWMKQKEMRDNTPPWELAANFDLNYNGILYSSVIDNDAQIKYQINANVILPQTAIFYFMELENYLKS